MRSQLLLLSLVSLAVTGCGKDVSKNGAIAGQVNPTGVVGQCADTVAAPNAPVIARFSDQARAGSYHLVSFEAVGTAYASNPMQTQQHPQNQNPAVGAATGISAVSGSVQANGQATYNQRCQDLSGMPSGTYSWNVSTPSQINAENGVIADAIAFNQTLRGPSAPANTQMRPAEARIGAEANSGCRSADAAIRGEGCSASTYYQLDASNIAVLRTTESRDMNGVLVRTKILAKYSLNGAAAANPNSSNAGDGFGMGNGADFGNDDYEQDDSEYSPSLKSDRPAPPTKKSTLPPVRKGLYKKSGLGDIKGNGQGTDPAGNGQGKDPTANGQGIDLSGMEVRHIVRFVKIGEPATVVNHKHIHHGSAEGKVVVNTDGAAKVKLKDKEKSKVKTTSETVTTKTNPDGSVETSVTTATTKEKNKSKLKIKVKKD